jgi:hypothetical protein
MKVAVYSNFYGADNLVHGNVNFNRVDPAIPHYFFTNNQVAGHKCVAAGWTVIPALTPASGDPAESNMQCKEEKVRPHLIARLQEYDFLVYRDAKLTGLDFGMLPRIIEKMKAGGYCAALPVHGRGVVDEVVESMFQKRYLLERQRIVNYVNEELRAGWAPVNPVHFGCCTSVRNQRHPDTEAMNNLWRAHIDRCGVQDQISFHFIAQQYKIMAIPQEFGGRRSEAPVPGWV